MGTKYLIISNSTEEISATWDGVRFGISKNDKLADKGRAIIMNPREALELAGFIYTTMKALSQEQWDVLSKLVAPPE